jgi:hypothetical protein
MSTTETTTTASAKKAPAKEAPAKKAPAKETPAEAAPAQAETTEKEIYTVRAQGRCGVVNTRSFPGPRSVAVDVKDEKDSRPTGSRA